MIRRYSEMDRLVYIALSLVILSSCTHDKFREPASVDLPAVLDSSSEFGRFHASVKWMKDPENDGDVLHGMLIFFPNFGKVQCSKIGFIQAAKLTLDKGQSYIWEMGERPRNEITTRGPAPIEEGFYIDHLATRCQKGSTCSPFFADHWPNEGESTFGAADKNSTQPATLSDYPFGWSLFSAISLEACAVCESTQDVYGCIRWGGSWPETGAPKHPTPSLLFSPSQTFLDARKRFRSYY